jgi:hypothetical protein
MSFARDKSLNKRLRDTTSEDQVSFEQGHFILAGLLGHGDRLHFDHLILDHIPSPT